jgi:hypothetical protein
MMIQDERERERERERECQVETTDVQGLELKWKSECLLVKKRHIFLSHLHVNFDILQVEPEQQKT